MPATLRFFRDDVLGLSLGAHEQDGLSLGGEVHDEVFGFLEQLDRLPRSMM